MLGSNAKISVFRRIVSPTGKESWSASPIVEAEVYLEQLSADMAVSMDGQFTYDMYRCYTDKIIDIQEGDKVIDNNNRVFSVQGVQNFPTGEIPEHAEIILNFKGTDEN